MGQRYGSSVVLMHGVLSTAPHRYFFASLLKGFKRLLLADKNRGSFCSEHSAPARIGYMDGSWMALLFHLCTLFSPVHFAQKLCHVEWVTCEHSEPATKRSQLSISSAANLLISVCKNFSKIVVEVFNSGQRMVKTVLVHVLHPSSPLAFDDGMDSHNTKNINSPVNIHFTT